MKLVPNWWHVLTRAWSVRLSLVAALLAILQGLESFVPVIRQMLPEPYASWATLFVIVAGIVARHIQQRTITNGKHQD